MYFFFCLEEMDSSGELFWVRGLNYAALNYVCSESILFKKQEMKGKQISFSVTKSGLILLVRK